MNVNRLLSLVVFVLVVAAARWLGPPGAWDNHPAIAVGAMLAAAAAAAVHWCLCRVLIDRSFAHAQRRVLALASGAASAPGQGWPATLARDIESTVSELGTRVRKLERELADAHRANLSLQSASGGLAALLRAIPDGLIITDGQDRVVLANAPAARALGFNADEARGQTLDQLLPDATLARLIRETRLRRDTRQVHHVEHAASTAGSASCELSMVCVDGLPDSSPGVVTVLRDLGERQRLSAVKTDLVCGVSHELRTPLSSIRAYAEMLLDGEATDEPSRRRFYSIIQAETDRLSRLIDNVLDISRIESGLVQVQRERVSLGDLVSDAIEVVRPIAAARSISLAPPPPGLSVSVCCDREMIRRALLNLLSNAINYTSDGGGVSVDLVADHASHAASIRVTDTGLGIPPDELPRLFEKFYRVREHRKVAQGTGLGLSLVKEIVETVHHGMVSVQSRVGSGSTFTLTLPLGSESDGSALEGDSGENRTALAMDRGLDTSDVQRLLSIEP